MKKTNQFGFSPIAILLVLILVVLVGLTGYYVFNTQKNKSAETPAPASATATPAQPSSQNTQKYLVIKEWGVSVPVAVENSVEYQISDTNKNTANFVSSEQKALGGSCGSFGMSRYKVVRIKNGSSIDDEILKNQMSNATKEGLTIKINDYTYYVIGDMSGGDCSGTAKEGSTVSNKELTANSNLLNILKKLQASN